jgi:two-component system, OmpR family, sensor kinase
VSTPGAVAVSLRPPHSLRARLLWSLLAAIVLTAMVQALIAYRTARAEADDIFDYHMQQMAMALRSGLPPGAQTPMDHDLIDDDKVDFVVQVWTAEGLRVYQSAARSSLPRRPVMGFSDLQARGTTYRVFSLQTRAQTIQVAQDMAARRAMAGTLALRTMAPIAVMAPALMLLVWCVVSLSLAPVARVRRQVATRQADDLSAVSDTDLPDEIRPLVQELNLLLERVRQALEAQKHFVADAAHELRSPLAALKLQAEGLRRAGDEATRERAVSRLSAGIERSTRLVEQLLVLARHQSASDLASAARPVPLLQVARWAVADASSSAQARHIDLGLAESEALTVHGHDEALRILLRNLIENAVKYTPEGGTVDVELRRRGDRAELVVEDSGPGIAPEDRARVLDRFFRVAGTETTGSGLGLAIVRSIADLHGATVELERSDRLGGLRVRVSLALESAP